MYTYYCRIGIITILLREHSLEHIYTSPHPIPTLSPSTMDGSRVPLPITAHTGGPWSSRGNVSGANTRNTSHAPLLGYVRVHHFGRCCRACDTRARATTPRRRARSVGTGPVRSTFGTTTGSCSDALSQTDFASLRVCACACVCGMCCGEMR